MANGHVAVGAERAADLAGGVAMIFVAREAVLGEVSVAGGAFGGGVEGEECGGVVGGEVAAELGFRARFTCISFFGGAVAHGAGAGGGATFFGGTVARGAGAAGGACGSTG